MSLRLSRNEAEEHPFRQNLLFGYLLSNCFVLWCLLFLFFIFPELFFENTNAV